MTMAEGLLTGSERFPCKNGGCRHKDSGWFLYFDDEGYSFYFECEDNPYEHDIELFGKWGDGSPIDLQHKRILSLSRKQDKDRARAARLAGV
jgi:hypothetical protein